MAKAERMRLDEALAKVPRLLPPQIVAIEEEPFDSRMSETTRIV